MHSIRTGLLIVVLSLATVAAGLVTVVGLAGCSDLPSASAMSSQYQTPGVYITSFESFGGGIVSALRSMNASCR